VLVATGAEAAVSVRSGFSSAVVAGGLTQPTAMAFAPDGRLFVCQQTGALRIIKNGQLLSVPFVTVPVDPSGERGLLGVALDPQFAVNHYVYIYYTATTTPRRNRVSRFTANEDIALTGSEVVLLELNALSATNHNGGALNFGPDGRLYVAVGDNANGANAQTLSNLLGKILRIGDDGSIPADNPFFSTASGVNRAIWALGLRNPFTFTFQPGTGLMHINDVGQNALEEIDEGEAGANYGWPLSEGPTSTPGHTAPIYWYGHGSGPQLGCAITGGAFYNPDAQQFPAEFIGDYFFGDFCGNWINVRDASTGDISTLASGVLAPVDLDIGPDGALYYLSRGSGNVGRITYATPRITSFTSLTAMPYRVGSPVSWKATVQGAGNAVQFQFWLFSSTSGQWSSTNYSSSSTFTFTPLEAANYMLQVWVRNVGSPAAFDAYRSSGTFAVLPTAMTITTLAPNQQLPLAAGAPVTWTAGAVGGSGTAEFRFWLYSAASSAWTMTRDYAPSPSWTWTPPQAGQYAIQAWGRSVGSAAEYDAWRGTGNLSVASPIPARPTLTVAPTLPVLAGRVLQWTTTTMGGRQPLQYQFWLFSQRTGAWTLGQAWSANNTWSWRPVEPGSYQVQIWMRSAGSTAPYDSWSSSGAFTIGPAATTAHAVSVFPALPAAPGTSAVFTALASGGTPPLEYQFWGLTAGNWTMLRDYDPERTFTWALTAGAHAVEAWVRSAGSVTAREAFASTGVFNVASRQATVQQVLVNQTFPLPVSTPIVWTVTATGGAGPLQYEFWRLTAGQWHLVQGWSPSSEFRWTPGNSDAGTHSFQVWVRAAGSSAAYDAWAPFGPVVIVP